MGVQITGVEQIEANLIRKARQMAGVEDAALYAAGKVMLPIIKAGMYDSGRAAGAKNTLMLGSVERDFDGKKSISIGWDRSGASAYIHFPEFGTINQPAQGKIENAYRSARGPATAAMRQVLRRMT